ncbi:MAG: DUF4382 domain-containing protein [Candidatus Helarchaeota archaeon]|nr:DUF4382 domain-containing protein [Candidatus Helarchaeota archaeon]
MRLLKIILSVSLIIFLIYNCTKNPTAPPLTMSTLRISLTDAPVDYENVNITFSEVSVKFGNEWKIINGQSQTLDLLTLTNGKTVLLGESELEPGKYHQIRLKVSAAEVIYNGQNYSLTVPSGAQSGLKFGPSFDIEAGITYELIVDFDANKSIVPLGPRKEYTGFILKPFIRVIPKLASGSISGRVTNKEDLPIAYAISGTDTLTSSSVDTTSGDFLLGYIPEGTYTVSVVDTLGKTYTNSGVSVTVGQTTNLGEITLQ